MENLRTIRRHAVYHLAAAGVGILSLLPLGMARFLARTLSGLAFFLIPKIRKTILDNIETAYEENLSLREKKELARDNLRHLGQVFAEFVHFEESGKFLSSLEIQWSGKEILEECMAGGRGLVFVTAHCGNWEILGGLLAREGYRVNAVSAIPREIRFEPLLDRFRKAAGIHVLHRGRTGLRLLRILREGEGIGILGDLDTRGDEAIYVDFFGKPAYTQTGAARLAARAGVPLVLGLIARTGPLSHRIMIEGPWRVTEEEEESGKEYTSVTETVRQYTARIEDWIRHYPDQWIWPHRRWRRNPERMRRRRECERG